MFRINGNRQKAGGRYLRWLCKNLDERIGENMNHKNTMQTKELSSDWTLIIDGEEQEKVDLEVIKNKILNLDALEEDSFLVLVKYIGSEQEEYLQVYADIDSEGNNFFTMDRGLNKGEENCDHYVHYTDDAQEVSEIFRLYYEENTIRYEQFEEVQKAGE